MLNRTMAEATPPAAGQKIARQKFSENNSNRPRHRPIVDARSRLADRRWRSREATTRSEVRSSGGGSRGGRLRSARLIASGFSRFSRSGLIPPPALLFANVFFGNQGSKSFPVSPAPPSAPAAPLFRAESWISPCPAKSPEFPHLLLTQPLHFPQPQPGREVRIQLPQRRLDQRLGLMVQRLLQRRTSRVGQPVQAPTRLAQARFQTHFLLTMTTKPASMVTGLVHRDPVNPGLERAVSPERSDIPENLQEHFLHH